MNRVRTTRPRSTRGQIADQAAAIRRTMLLYAPDRPREPRDADKLQDLLGDDLEGDLEGDLEKDGDR